MLKIPLKNQAPLRHLKNSHPVLILVAWLCCGISPAFSQNKPNVVIFIADDLNQQDIGCYGNSDVSTPNMDRLAAEGMRFNRAYAATPMCAPSRSVMFTGLYPFRNGSQMNHFTVRPHTRNLPQFLQQLGYRVVISGKTDVFPLHNFPFEKIGKAFGQYFPVANRLDRKKETVQMIGQHFKERPEQPICLIVAPWVPHVPWFPNRDFDPGKLKVPDYLADTKATRKALAAYYQSIGAADKMLGEVLQAVDKAGQKNNTVVMCISDQGAQFPSAKWSAYDQGLRVPLIVRWPGKVAAGSVSDALVSLVDLTPTLVDLGGGKEVEGLDGRSFKEVLLNKTKAHHSYIFAETSMEPHFWYNYTPARTIITADGFHYIRNYHPGARFITHIDKVEQNEFYFDSWVAAAETDPRARMLLHRYSYHPPEELFDLNTDRNEFNNLAADPAYHSKVKELEALLDKELQRQGETDAMILEGPLPQFFDQGYAIRQNMGASSLSFNKKRWNPDTLIITAYLDGMDKGGVVCDYFNNFKLYAYQHQVGLVLANGATVTSRPLQADQGHLIFRLSREGDLEIRLNRQVILKETLQGDLTKIKGGYVTCGKIQGEELAGKLQPYEGKITDLRFTMNELSRMP
ncbi:sulfatase family protein [Chitinophaga japonensis]|uniref:Arylsulfatase A-like enzyme n=1 Tax=Chitinophaga japonensis TaxID=104662 RepID=A0A562T0J9_CHIJA|nr:sulfatase [Chitinophaga japonensis]TWI86828.1 arylsulfatase A-like enzyme [Chitinophaga japonensis]